MNNKQALLTQLKEEFGRWEELLESMSDEQINTSQPHTNW